MHKGILIDIEGTDGSGKHAQTEMLFNRLAKEGLLVKQLSFPCYDSLSSALIKMYLGGAFGVDPGKVNPYAASTFYAVDRFASYQTDWKGLYETGGIILTDRYTDSNTIHQGGKMPTSQKEEYIKWLYDFEFGKMSIPRPDMVIFLDVPTDVSARMRAERETKTHTTADIHERDNDYLAKCRTSALDTGLKNGWNIIPCVTDGEMRPIEDIHEDIYRLAKELISRKKLAA